MSNLRYINTIRSDNLPTSNPWTTPNEHLIKRNEWLQRQIRKFYSVEELQNVLTNRRSDFSDEALSADFKRAEQPLFVIPEDNSFTRAVNAVTEQFRPNRVLHPVQYPDLRYYPLSLNVSAEAPWTNKNFKFKPMDRNIDAESEQPKVTPTQPKKLRKWNRQVNVDEYLRWKHSAGLTEDSSRSFRNLYSEIFIYNRPLIHMIKEGEGPFWQDGQPVTYEHLALHARSHVVKSDEPDKIRAVFGAPKLVLQTELPFIWPLQATYLNTEAGRLLWGKEMSRGGWRKLFTEIQDRGPHSTYLGIDWSEFDKRLLHQLIRIVHKIWRSYFDFTQYEPTSTYPHATPRDPNRIERLWEWMCNAITGTPIMLPNGQLWTWTWNGFGSGFQQTQLMDSFANAIMIYTCLLSLGVNVESKHFWARFQGDDSLLAFCEQMCKIYGNDFLEMIGKAAKHYFNAKLNVKKSEIQNQISGMSVLSYPNHHGTPFRDDEDLLRHLYFPERPQDYGRLAASAIGLAQASLGCSKRFYDLARLVHHKIVHEHNTPVKWKALRWLERMGMNDLIEQLQNADFPDYMRLLSQAITPVERSERENERQWPTMPESKNGFYFILPV